jgi:hypothetical protein
LDVSRFRVGDWVLTAAGAIMLVLGLGVHWATVHASGRDYGGARNAFDYPLTGGLAWVLTVAAGVVTFLVAARLVGPGRTPWTRLTVAATALATLLMFVRLTSGGGADQRIGNQQVTLGRGPGMLIAVAAAAAALVGALLNLRAEDDSVAAMWASLTRRGDDGRSSLPPPTPGTPSREPPSGR